MNKTTTVKLIKLPNPYGRIYPTEVLENAVKQCQKQIDDCCLYVGKHCPSYVIESIDIVGIIKKLTIRDDGVYGDIEFLDTPAYKEVIETIKGIPNKFMSDSFTIVGLGNVKDNVVQSDYEITGAYFV